MRDTQALKEIVRKLTRAEGSLLRLLVITGVVVLLMGVLDPYRFFTARNLSSMCFQFPELGIFSLAIMVINYLASTRKPATSVNHRATPRGSCSGNS